MLRLGVSTARSALWRGAHPPYAAPTGWRWSRVVHGGVAVKHDGADVWALTEIS